MSEDSGTPIPTEGSPAWVEANWSERNPLARGVARMVYDSVRETTWLIGGQSIGPLPLGDVWEWRDDWTLAEGVDVGARKNHGVAFDRVRAQVVIFGGIVGGLAVTPEYRNDTVEWDGTQLRAIHTSTAPDPRSGHAMVFDEARAQTVLFGGANDTTEFGDTFVYDGREWTAISSTLNPPARFNAQMVYDSHRERVLLFGGQTSSGEVYNDLWTWNGTDWQEISVEGERPEGRGFFAMAYDRGRDRVVVHGGTTRWPPFIDATNTWADHWEFDGSRWWPMGDIGPGLRSGHQLVYDESRESLLLFGGVRDGQTLLADTWKYYRCQDAESICRENQRLVCANADWNLAETCSVGSSCMYDPSRTAQCAAARGCAGYTPAPTIVRFDAGLFGTYRVFAPGVEASNQFDLLLLAHTTLSSDQSIPDPTTTNDLAVRLTAYRGDQIFLAVRGTLTPIQLGAQSLEPYQVILSDVELVEAVVRDGGLEIAEGGETTCLEHAQLESVIVPYFCQELDDSLTVGETACFDHDGASMVVACEVGVVSDSTGNLGKLVVQERCTDAMTCALTAETVAECVVP